MPAIERGVGQSNAEPVFVNVYGDQESIPTTYDVVWRAGTTNRVVVPTRTTNRVVVPAR
jgi:hypothetical protein